MADRTDRIWDKLLEMAADIGGIKSSLSSCVDRIGLLAEHQKVRNGNDTKVLMRLEALELADAEECGEQRGARRQWVIIAGVIAATSCVFTTVGIIIGFVVR